MYFKKYTSFLSPILHAGSVIFFDAKRPLPVTTSARSSACTPNMIACWALIDHRSTFFPRRLMYFFFLAHSSSDFLSACLKGSFGLPSTLALPHCCQPKIHKQIITEKKSHFSIYPFVCLLSLFRLVIYLCVYLFPLFLSPFHIFFPLCISLSLSIYLTIYISNLLVLLVSLSLSLPTDISIVR